MSQSETKNQYYELQLPDKEPFSSYDTGDARKLAQLSLINLFIGSNNSGKSLFARNLFIEKGYEYTTKTFNANVYLDYVKKIRPEFIEIFQDVVTQIGETPRTILDKFRNKSSYYISPTIHLYTEILSALDTTQRQSGNFITQFGVTPNRKQTMIENLRIFGLKKIEELKKLKIDGEVTDTMHYYIPIIRGMRPLDSSQENLYQQRTISDYFNKNQEDTLTERHSVFTGLELYKTLKGKLLGEPEDRDAVKRYEEFLSHNFFDSKSITLIPREGDNTVHVKIGNEKQLPLFNLGDGLQNLIIITFNMFMESERCLFFIEEPDLCMHPGLQRAFIETISNLNHHQYFITTHSNHFLDMTLDFSDISVYLFRKNVEEAGPKFSIRLVSSRDHNLLQSLGVRNSSVFLTNATIWVEGITDRLYLRAYMKKYIEDNFNDKATKEGYSFANLKEDYHYSLIEYQGSNLTHWSFNIDEEEDKRIKANFICGNPVLIADGDIENKGDRLTIYKDMLGDKLVVLKCKEIENLLPLEVLKELAEPTFQEHGKDINSLNYDDYSKPDIGLGDYLDKLLSADGGEAKFSEKSGTIKNKVKICNDAINIMNDHDFNWALTAELTELCKKIFGHILEHNSNTHDERQGL